MIYLVDGDVRNRNVHGTQEFFTKQSKHEIHVLEFGGTRNYKLSAKFRQKRPRERRMDSESTRLLNESHLKFVVS